MSRRKNKKAPALKYNRDHPRPGLGSGAQIGDVPRTIDADIPELVEITDEYPVMIEGERVYQMGECIVRHRMVPEVPGKPWPGHALSVSHKDRYPTWDEVTEARYRLIPDNVLMVMPLPPSDQYLNIHPYMFNLHEVRFAAVMKPEYAPGGRRIGRAFDIVDVRAVSDPDATD